MVRQMRALLLLNVACSLSCFALLVLLALLCFVPLLFAMVSILHYSSFPRLALDSLFNRFVLLAFVGN